MFFGVPKLPLEKLGFVIIFIGTELPKVEPMLIVGGATFIGAFCETWDLY